PIVSFSLHGIDGWTLKGQVWVLIVKVIECLQQLTLQNEGSKKKDMVTVRNHRKPVELGVLEIIQ
ncbi:hypothetical protein FRX31_029815, partial [Thalictrum thalictroides]